MKVCKDCTEHKMVYDEIVDENDCECYCHIEMESGCVYDPCCR